MTDTGKPVAEIKEKKIHEPLLVMSKRGAVSIIWSIAIRAIAIVAALLFCGVVTVVLTDTNPIDVYVNIFKGAFGNDIRIWATLQEIAMLLCVALAVTPAFKMRFWNTGAEGQVLIGCLTTAICMMHLGGRVPDGVLIIIMVIASVLSGVIWGVIPAIFKAKWGTNETLFTLMMNYVAIQLISTFVTDFIIKSGQNSIGSNVLKHGWLPEIFGQQYLLNIVIVAILTVLMYIYLKYTKHGYEIAVVGESENTAKYVGINVKKVIIRTMAVSGGLCGLVGLLLVAGTSHSIDSNLADGRGFTAIMVSWLAKFNPLMMTLTTFLIVVLDMGAREVATMCELNESFSDILTGIILFFIIGCEFFIQYKVHFNKKHRLFTRKSKEEA